MWFCALASGSKGNSWLVATASTKILIDCGVSLANLSKRLQTIGQDINQIDGVFITHEHSDHIGGLASLQKKHPQIQIYCSRGTANMRNITKVQYLVDGVNTAIGDINIESFTVPHDSKEPLQYKFTKAQSSKALAIVTDLGCRNRKLLGHLQNITALALEFNYDEKMLLNGDYPASLKKRISGNYGHLSNEQASNILGDLINEDNNKIALVVAAHLSENNNDPKIVEAILSQLSQNKTRFNFAIAKQNEVGQCFEL